ncbi:MAG: sigma 54-interacting transcriptional regulator [Acidobacteria bacterium]|nr:sigma 54-interacting transcriptional regulator [Acidobacteriota bacterium]
MTQALLVRKLTDNEKDTLQEWQNSDDQEKSRRAKVIILSSNGKTAIEISQEMGFHPDNLKKWIRRFNQEGISGIEILKRGPKNRFSNEQMTAILNLYKQSPKNLGLDFATWTPQKLAIEAVKLGIVSQISHVTMRDILREGTTDSTLEENISTEENKTTTEPFLETELDNIEVENLQNNPPKLNKFSLSEIKLTPTVSELLSLGQNALKTSENQEAVNIFQRLLTHPDLSIELQGQVRSYLSEAYEALSSYEEALAAVSMYEDNLIRNQLSSKLQARVKLRLGWGYCRLSNYAKALTRFNEARTIYVELADTEGLGAVHHALGYAYVEINESNLARGYLLKGLEGLRYTDDTRLLARVYIDLGLVNYKEGDFEGAKASYLKAQSYTEGITDPSILGLISMNLGTLYVEYGKRDEATQYLARAVKEFTVSGQNSYLARAYNNLGNNLLYGGRWREAAENLSRALELARKLGDRENTWLTLITLGELRFFQGEYDKAEESLLTALGLLTDGDKWAEAYAQRVLGLIYISNNRPDKASQVLRTALQLATRIGSLYEVCLSQLALAEHHLSQASYEQAEEYLELAKENLKGKHDLDLSASGWAQRLAGKLALIHQRFEEAKQHISASINIFASINNKYELAMSKLEMGLLYMQIGELSSSRDVLTDARDKLMDLGAMPGLKRANEMLLALQRGEVPKTHSKIESTLNRDVLLMQRLIEAANSKDLLLKEFATVIYENFVLAKLIIFDANNYEKLEPIVVIGCSQKEAIDLIIEINRTLDFGKTTLGISHLHILEDRVNSKFCLYLEPKPNTRLEIPRLKPLFKQAELALENCSLRALTRSTLVQEHDKVKVQTLIPGFIYASPAMQDVVERIKKIRTSDTTVLITGESGTGKELVARALHAESSRRDAIFLPFNCTATPKDLIESQLFGHRRGAFTGATNNYPGIIRAADGGTLFLDEIGDLSLDAQPKLLRFLEAGEIQPLGETKPMKVDVRILAATNALLEKAVEEGRFREDLLFRLNIIRLHVPPLRERKEEIPLLAEHYLQHFASRSGKKTLSFSPDVMYYFANYNWPGNIRQLRGEIERMVAYTEDATVLNPRDLSPELTRAPISTVIEPKKEVASPIFNTRKEIENTPSHTLKEATDQLERELIEEMLLKTSYNISRTAKELGLSRRGLRLKMFQLGLEK